MHLNFEILQIARERKLNIALKRLRKVCGVKLSDTFGPHSVEILAVVFSQVTHKVFVNYFVANHCCFELDELKFDRILIQNTF